VGENIQITNTLDAKQENLSMPKKRHVLIFLFRSFKFICCGMCDISPFGFGMTVFQSFPIQRRRRKKKKNQTGGG